MYHMKPNYEIFESRIQKLLYKNIAAIMQIMIIIIYHKSFSWIVYMANIARKNFIVSRDVVTSTFILPIFQLSFARLSFNAMKEAGSIWKVSNYTEATAANAAQLLNFFNVFQLQWFCFTFWKIQFNFFTWLGRGEWAETRKCNDSA